MRWVIPVSTLVIGPLFVVVIAGVLYGLFAALHGRRRDLQADAGGRRRTPAS